MTRTDVSAPHVADPHLHHAVTDIDQLLGVLLGAGMHWWRGGDGVLVAVLACVACFVWHFARAVAADLRERHLRPRP